MARHPFWPFAVILLAPLGIAHAQSQPWTQFDQNQLAPFSERHAEAWSSREPENAEAFFSEAGQLPVNGGEPAVGREAIAANWPLGDGSVWRVAADQGGTPIRQPGQGSEAETEIRMAIRGWVDVYNRNDWGVLAEEFTEEAVMLPPNSPAVAGRAAIAAWQAAHEDGFGIVLKPDEISILGDRAVIRGRSCVFIPLEAGNTGVDVGKFLEVRRRQPDGRWLISHDAFSSDRPVGRELAEDCPEEIAEGTVRREGAADASRKDSDSDLTPILDNRTRVILEGINSGDVSGIMALYGPGALYSTDNATMLVSPEAIEAFWVSVAASPVHDAALELLRIERLGPDAFVEIQKYDVFDDAGERLFGGYAALLWRRVEGRWMIAADVSN
jgi:uncharacterized protein (TIGR02246 family)